tara:strand:- start:3895 stop:4488 length:594 start_codon:yes stop_codon:yes gene_type:complete
MRPVLILMFLILIVLTSCQQAAEKHTKSVEEKVEKFEKSAKKEGTWLQELIATEAHTDEVLLSKLPKQLAGVPLRSSASPAAQTVAATYSLNANPNHETENISLTIIDGAGNYGFGHLNAIHKMISMEVNNQEANGWAKTQDHKGNRILLKESLDKGIQFSELEYIKDNRYHITLSGRRYDSNKLLQAKEELEKLKF